MGSLCARGGALVPRVARDTHDCDSGGGEEVSRC